MGRRTICCLLKRNIFKNFECYLAVDAVLEKAVYQAFNLLIITTCFKFCT